MKFIIKVERTEEMDKAISRYLAAEKELKAAIRELELTGVTVKHEIEGA